MVDVTEHLTRALADRYRIERELGAGGMATVYLATDLRHERPVAIKVLRPELAASLGSERFLREIKIAARLNHPHILPLHDSGEAQGFLYYVMPFAEGESLRDRLDREKQLPVHEAVRIAGEVADALSYAHSQGVVHRDIKPENVMLGAGHAVVTDFGIARAISAAGGETLTQTGTAIGTPTYMSPEQAAGSKDLDGRSDIYSLGCVLFEMLAGRPPFTGPTVESVVHQHLTAPPPLVTAVRAAVPPDVAAALTRALQKTPADRWATAQELTDALGTARLAASPKPRTAAGWRVRPAWAAAGLALLALIAAVILWWPEPATDVDPSVVAVLPFRVSTPDGSLDYLREGMVDLLAAKLTGEGGPRAADPRAVVSAWRRAGGNGSDLPEDAALKVARQIGAGRLLFGSVIGTRAQLQIQASLVGVPQGRARARAQVAGGPDSLPALVDELAAQLLAREAGEMEQRLTQLTSTSLPALRAYLAGQSAYRRGEYVTAAGLYESALGIDSTFALAGLGLVAAKNWTTGGFDPAGVAAAWANRERLSERDRALLTTFAGPRYPAPATAREQYDALQRAVALAPDRPEPWYWLGEIYFHAGKAMELAAPFDRAEEAFSRAVALDSSFVAPLGHLVDLTARGTDTTLVVRMTQHYLSVDSVGDFADAIRWASAVYTGDSVQRSALRARFERMTTQTLRGILGDIIRDGEGIDDAVPIARILERRADAGFERYLNLSRTHDALLSLGRPAWAARLTDLMEELEPLPHFTAAIRVLDGLFGEGDTTVAARSASALEAVAARALAGRASIPTGENLATCAIALWHASRNRWSGLERAIEKLGRPAPPEDNPAFWGSVGLMCATALEALVAANGRRPDAAQLLNRLDSLMRTLPTPLPHVQSAGNLTAARLHESAGDLRSAVAAARRQVYVFGTYESAHLKEEGRLAALLGDREAAIRAYERYLTLRADPEPSVLPEVERTRAELARLVGKRDS